MQQEQRELLHTLYEKHQSVLYNIALAKGLPREEAADAVQDTYVAFASAYLKDASSWDEGMIKANLMVILRNRCCDYYRKVNRRPPVLSLEELIQERGEPSLYDVGKEDICGRLIAQESRERLRKGVMSLSREMQDVVVLYMVEGRPFEEVCELLHISKDTCRMRICRIRKHLREWLEHPEITGPKKRGRPKGVKNSRPNILPRQLGTVLGTDALMCKVRAQRMEADGLAE